jgi:Phosphopantetheine attachment site
MRPDRQVDLQRWLGSIWAAVLGLDEVCAEDNFLALGGHSLLAVRAIYVIRAELDAHIPLSALLQAEDLASFAASVESELPSQDVEPQARRPAKRL